MPHPALIDRVYTQAEQVVENTNGRVRVAKDLVDGLRTDGVLITGPAFSQPIDFVYFDLWHYDGRTANTPRSWAAPILCNGTEIIP